MVLTMKRVTGICSRELDLRGIGVMRAAKLTGGCRGTRTTVV